MDLDAIRKRCAAATKGPWHWCNYVTTGDRTWYWNVTSDLRGICGGHDKKKSTAPTDADGDFIAHARTDIPALLEEVGRLTKLLDGAREDALTFKRAHVKAVEEVRGLKKTLDSPGAPG